MNRIYMDYAATSPMEPSALEAMTACLRDVYGNPMSQHAAGRQAREALERARAQTARAVGADRREIYFTAGGTESDNWAIRGTAARFDAPGHMVISAIEHHAVLNACEILARRGWRITRLPVNAEGRVDPARLRESLSDETRLVSIMLANNEIGVIEPIRDLCAVAHERGALFHTDAVQAVGAIPVDVRELGVDMLSLSAHKFGGPKGVGALYVREGVWIAPFLAGGAQERGRRAGTENVPGAVGLGAAIEIASRDPEATGRRIQRLRDRLIDAVLGRIPGSALNGAREGRLPGNANLLLMPLESGTLTPMLDLAGIAASNGAACAAGSPEPSHVLRAIGLTPEEINGSVRLSLGRGTTIEEVDAVVEALKSIADRLGALAADRRRKGDG